MQMFYHCYKVIKLIFVADEQSEYFKNLKHLIEDTYALNGNKKVVLLVHSLGGLMTLTFLNNQSQQWKDQYIRAIISLAGAWGGSAKAVKVYAIGKCALYLSLIHISEPTRPY